MCDEAIKRGGWDEAIKRGGWDTGGMRLLREVGGEAIKYYLDSWVEE